MNKLKSIFSVKNTYFAVILLLLIFIAFEIDKNDDLARFSTQYCHEEALGILLDAFVEEDAFNTTMLLETNSEEGVRELERYKLQYDIAFDICLDSRGYTN